MAKIEDKKEDTVKATESVEKNKSKKVKEGIEITKLLKNKVCLIVEEKQINLTERVTIIPYSDALHSEVEKNKDVKFKIIEL